MRIIVNRRFSDGVLHKRVISLRAQVDSADGRDAALIESIVVEQEDGTSVIVHEDRVTAISTSGEILGRIEL
jgi:hypothetical protein